MVFRGLTGSLASVSATLRASIVMGSKAIVVLVGVGGHVNFSKW